ncbi:hypothetical protein L596_028754 [Steinernema carpocapsae]|uniref:Uncharacterized protein n=1 Tax=Steinernema carpocapsae TaxID=34508 RepID=A0A4U5M0C1_STECR|nr:hypothetical protein L596_028754 [Steinernema carpocapsae]
MSRLVCFFVLLALTHLVVDACSSMSTTTAKANEKRSVDEVFEDDVSKNVLTSDVSSDNIGNGNNAGHCLSTNYLMFPDGIHAEIHTNIPFENEEQAKGIANYLESQLGLASWFLNVHADDLKQAERVIEEENGSVKITYNLKKKGGCSNAHTIGDLAIDYMSEIEKVDIECEGEKKQYKR